MEWIVNIVFIIIKAEIIFLYSKIIKKMTPSDLCFSIYKNQKNFFDSKKSIDLTYRIKSLKKLKKTIVKFEDKILHALNLDLGKGYAESYMSEISIIYNEINYVLRNIKKWSHRKKVSSSLLNFF